LALKLGASEPMRRRGCSAVVARKRRSVGVLAARRVVKAGFAVARTERRKREAILMRCFVEGGGMFLLVFDASTRARTIEIDV
jgi:hypothetical protein